MKWRGTLFVAVLAVIGAVAYFTNSWGEDVRNSKHNLATNPNVGATTSSGSTVEVCVFCHTPHGGDTTVAGGAAPLWNRQLSTATYTMYTSPNFDGLGMSAAPANQPKGVSLACLSCHDGTVAFDSLFNHPGSGSTDTITFNPTSGTPRVSTTTGMMINTPGGPEYPMLGTNLSNDHPISMTIPCGVDPQFTGICANLDTAALAAGRVSFLTRDTATYPLPVDIRNRLRAYPSVSGGAYIECASCHNPHIGDTESTRFLRLASWNTADPAYSATDRNAGSLICLSCHEK